MIKSIARIFLKPFHNLVEKSFRLQMMKSFLPSLPHRYLLLFPLRSSHLEVFCEKVFLKIHQNLQENTGARVSFLIKLLASGLRPAALLKKSLWYRCFPVNFAKFLRAPIFIEHLRWLLLSSVPATKPVFRSRGEKMLSDFDNILAR